MKQIESNGKKRSSKTTYEKEYLQIKNSFYVISMAFLLKFLSDKRKICKPSRINDIN